MITGEKADKYTFILFFKMWLTCDRVTYITKHNTYAVLPIRPVIFYDFYFYTFIDILFQFLIVHLSFILISVFLSKCKNYEV